jgi:DnaK suppressor protein
MKTKQINETRRRLVMESEKLIQSISRNRAAAEEITTENTEDEGDLASISHNKELLYNLHESDCVCLRFVGEAIKALDRGRYGECVRCGNEINAKRLLAVPWATLCIRCQEETEMEDISSRWVLSRQDDQTDM